MRFKLKLYDIELKNFRLFDEIKITFDEKLTVLIGGNGAGKTSSLEGVAKALNAIISRLRSNTTVFNENEFYSQADVKYGKDAIFTDIKLVRVLEDDDDEIYKRRKLELEEIEKGYKQRFEELNEKLREVNEKGDNALEEINFWSREIELLEQDTQSLKDSLDEELGQKIELGNNNIRYKLNPTFAVDTQKEAFEEQNLWNIDEVARIIDKARKNKKEISLPIIAYYPCSGGLNSINGQEQVERMDIFNAYDHALDGYSLNFKSFLEWYIWQDQIERFSNSNKVLEVVKSAILEMLNDEGEEIFSNIYIDPTQFKNPRLMLDKGEEKQEFNQLSSGQKSFLLLVGNIAYRLALLNPNSKDPLKYGQGIVLIDEIDLHLHPLWQRKVIPKLLDIFPNIQWVITTHSPFVLQNIASHSVLILDNGQLYSSEDTQGQDISSILNVVMEVPTNLYKKEIKEIYKQLALNKLEDAEALIQNLDKKVEGKLLELEQAKILLEKKQRVSL